MEKFIQDNGTLKPRDNGEGWTVTVKVGLDDKALAKPIKAKGLTKKAAIQDATKQLLDLLQSKQPKGTPLMVPVVSSNIDRVGYDEKKQELYVRFKGSGTYVFRDVPVKKAEGLINAASHGKYFADEIKDQYEHDKF